jgi:hypothetical protein
MATASIGLGEWFPDLPFLENPGLVEALNAIPTDKHYKEFLPLSTADDALGARVSGAFSAIDSSGTTYVYAGNSTALSVKSGSSWVELSGATYNTALDGYWRFTQHDALVIATNYEDGPQAATVGAATFGALATSGTAPKARQVAQVGQFVMLGDTNESVNGIVPHRVQWSGIDAPRSWPEPGSDTAIAQQAGEQFLNVEAGPVSGIFGGDQYAIIAQRTSITRATYVGGGIVFQFDTIDENRGAWFPNASVQLGRVVFFAGFDGFYKTDGVSVVPIGAGKVDRTFLADCDQSFRERVRAAIDYQNKCIVWTYPTVTASSGTPNRVLFYNFAEDRWSHAEDEIEVIFPAYSAGLTLDQLDALYTSIDDIALSLDSLEFQGGVKTMMAFGPDHKLGTFSGAQPVARFETGEIELNPDGLAFVSGVRPLFSGNPTDIAVQLGTRSAQDNEARSFTAAVSRYARTGRCDFRKTARFFTARIDVTGGFDRSLGLKVEWQPAGAV